MSIALEKVCEIQVDLTPEALEVGLGPYGHRRVLEIVGGTVSGEKLSGVVLPGGADWLLLDATGWGRLDIRMQWRLDDGATIIVSAQGLCEFNERVIEAGKADRLRRPVLPHAAAYGVRRRALCVGESGCLRHRGADLTWGLWTRNRRARVCRCIADLREAAQLLAILAAQQLGALAGVGFGLAHPAAQDLGVDAQIAGYLGNRPASKTRRGAAVQQFIGYFFLRGMARENLHPPGQDPGSGVS